MSKFAALRKLSPEAGEAPTVVKKLAAAADYTADMVAHRQYQGSNPAVAAAYPTLRATMIIMLALFFLLFVLGSTVPIESAAVAKGTIVVMSNKKTVQHLEGGVIKSILVKDGDLVKEGQPLIELNNVATKANQSIVQTDLYASRVAEARLLALKDRQESMQIAPEILNDAQADSELAKTIATQQDLFVTQKESHEGKVKTLRQHNEQANEEIVGLEAQVKSADGQLALINKEEVPVQKLVDKGYAAMPQLLALQRQRAEVQGNRGQYLASIAKAKQSITETELQIANADNDFATQIADELRDVQGKISDFEEKLRATSDVVERSVITAPYEGVVTGLKYHTIGGVITPGTPIMDIVPQTDSLVVEAQVQPTDIDMLEVGQETRIMLSAYKSRSMPRLTGRVVNISADAFSAAPQQAGQAGAASYYNVRVVVDADQLGKLSTKVKLAPGMPVEVFIRTGSRSFLSYMMAPINSSLSRAFKEE